jgi:aconitase A
VSTNSFGTRDQILAAGRSYTIHRLSKLEERGFASLAQMPFSLKILLENLLRCEDGLTVTREDVEALANWDPQSPPQREISFMPARVLMQDFTGVPAVVDLAAMRDAMAELGGDPTAINPLQPADLVIDHSVQVDRSGSADAFLLNAEIEMQRNRERYAFLKWGQTAFRNFRTVPPDTGIVHQINLEYLASVVFSRDDEDGETLAYPDTLVGTDSHTTMINGLGVLGWGVGGIEAEAAMLGQPVSMLIPEVVGFRLHGSLPEGATATDLVLTVTETLRKHGVVGKFVEFYGEGLGSLSLADRATIANMAPEYGATMGFFPVDEETLAYLRFTGRPSELVALVEVYCREQGIFRSSKSPDPVFRDKLELDLGTIEPSMAGPKRPQDRVPLRDARRSFREALTHFGVDYGEATLDKALADSFPASDPTAEQSPSHDEQAATDELSTFADGAAVQPRKRVQVEMNGESFELRHGSVVIAAITSCTNTSNPAVMLQAGLLARNAVEKGLATKPWVKTSLAPGSKVVTEYLKEAGLTPYLEKLGFHLVGYGCTTCIAEGTPVLMADGTSRRIEQLPLVGGDLLLAPTQDGELRLAEQSELMTKGVSECVSVVLQDGRTLVCTPDHELLCSNGRWKRADELVPGQDRVMVGLEAPLDERRADEAGYVLTAGDVRLDLDSPEDRLSALAFARLLGHLLGDGSISVAGQARINVGQAIDREVVLEDIERLTGKRPMGVMYDERKWSIVLPQELTRAIVALPGVRVGRRIDQAAVLPEFVLDPSCPLALVRELLGGLFGADGQAPVLHRYGPKDDDGCLMPPAYSQSTKPEHIEALKSVMSQLTSLLARVGVDVEGAKLYEYPVRRSQSSYPAAADGAPRVEVRLQLPDGLSFIENVGFRYCVDKSMRSTAAAVYWRTVDKIHEQRQWMASRISEIHAEYPELSFNKAREMAADELKEREAVVFPHYSLLEGHDRFSRLPEPSGRKFRPLHRDTAGFPSVVELFEQLGVRDWFAPLQARSESDASKRYCVEKASLTLPAFSLQVLDRKPAGRHPVFDLTVKDLHAFVAGTVAVSNCIGNSGPLPEPIVAAIDVAGLVAASVLSGNRNFEGRVHAKCRANYLASPPLVVAYALAGTMDFDPYGDPIGHDGAGAPVYLKDIWPTQAEVHEAIRAAHKSEQYLRQYGAVFEGNDQWNALSVPEGDRYAWEADSTYIRHPPYFVGMQREPGPISDIRGARVLALLGDSVTTDHISPAGNIARNSPAAQYLTEHGVKPGDFNSYGSRRGNHEVMVRGTFANIRLRNLMAPGTEGGYTRHQPSGDQCSIYDASVRYAAEGVPLLIIAGKEYGTGSSRDWAAKGPVLLGVRAVLAESYERIHRSNLVGMGILPLQFLAGQSRETHALDGSEVYDIAGLAGLRPLSQVTVQVTRADGSRVEIPALVRIDTPVELEYYRHGGILLYVLRRLVR